MRIGEGRSPLPSPSPSSPGPTPAASEARETRETRKDDGPSPFARLLRGLGHEVDRGEAMVRSAIGAGGELGPTELLALQAGVYRYSEAVDLSAKLVDRAANGVKTVIQGQ